MSNTIQMTSAVAPGYTDPRRLQGVDLPNDSGSGVDPDFENRIVDSDAVFTANAAGSTTTIVGANGDPAAGTNVVRLGDKFKLFDSTGALKEETVFTVDSIAVAASDTVTFSPAAVEATESGDEMFLVGLRNTDSMADLDQRLLDLGFAQTTIDLMTLNDKFYQIRTSDDPDSIFARNDNALV